MVAGKWENHEGEGNAIFLAEEPKSIRKKSDESCY